jgi:hypothetical protein
MRELVNPCRKQVAAPQKDKVTLVGVFLASVSERAGRRSEVRFKDSPHVLLMLESSPPGDFRE